MLLTQMPKLMTNIKTNTIIMLIHCINHICHKNDVLSAEKFGCESI